MKKIYFALAVLATAAFTSCVNEQSFKDQAPVPEDAIAFVMKGVSPRSEGNVSNATMGITLSFGKTPQGEPIYMEETIEQINPSPATRGIPAYTENVGVLYKDELSVRTSYADFYETQFERESDTMENGGWTYFHRYVNVPWPSGKVDFYLRMPIAGTGVSSLAHDITNKKVSFSLESPATAAAQQDLLFGFTSLTQEEHDSYRAQGGAPVLMYHALSAVKFANGHPNDNQTKTIISKVEFTGLKDNGTCTIQYSATGEPVITWSGLGTRGDASAPFIISQEFANPDYTPSVGASNSDGTVDFTDTSTALQLPGTSWTSAAATHNLNDANGSLTFWFIPQAITGDVKLNVTFCVKTPDSKDGTEIVRTINFGQLVNAKGTVTWEAGQLRTYTLKPYDVDVEIEDTMTATIKSNVHIANTGNVDEYVRVLIMGNWYGWKPGTTAAEMASTEPSILVGYKYSGLDDENLQAAVAAGGDAETLLNQMVDPWYREGYEDPSNPGHNYDPYGYFDDSFTLAKLGDRDGKRNDWADASGGFYYTMKIGPGEKFSGTNSATKDLFKSYTVTNVPDIYLPSGNGRAAAVGVHLVLEIVVQAIEVPKVKVGDEEKDVWWLQAWYEATGVSKLDPEASRNALYLNYYNNHEYDPE